MLKLPGLKLYTINSVKRSESCLSICWLQFSVCWPLPRLGKLVIAKKENSSKLLLYTLYYFIFIVQEAEIHIKAGISPATYRVVKPLYCKKDTSGSESRFALSLFGQDTTRKTYVSLFWHLKIQVHNYIYRHTITGDYVIESSSLIYGAAFSEAQKTPFESA